MRIASKNFVPARRERKKAPAYIKRLANISNTAFEMENGDRVIRRPTYQAMLTAAHNIDINRTSIFSMVQRYVDTLGTGMTKKIRDKYMSQSELFAKAWRKQEGRCYFTGIKLAGGPEFLGLGAGFHLSDDRRARVMSYPLAVIYQQTPRFSSNGVDGWRHISQKEATNGSLEILLWRKIIPALRTSRIRDLPLRYSLIKNVDEAYTLKVEGIQITKFNESRDYYANRNPNSDKPYWYIQSVRTNHYILSATIHDGVFSIGLLRDWQEFDPTQKFRDSSKGARDIGFALADPATTVQKIVDTIVEAIYTQFVGKYAYELTELSYKFALNGDLTECDIWRI